MEVGTGEVREDAVALSRLIDVINERFETDWKSPDQLFFDQIIEAAVLDETLKQAASVNPEEKFELVFKNLLETLFMERMDQNEEIVARFMNDMNLRSLVTGMLASETYRKLGGNPGKYPDYSKSAQRKKPKP